MSKAKNVNIWFEKQLIYSKAFAELKTANAHKALAFFFTKRQCAPTGIGRWKKWEITNNGDIVFTYKEAKKKLGIKSDQTFTNTIDELRDKGFVDIASTGMGVYKVTTLYSISDRWRLYGTPEYKKPKPRPKGPINRGFQKGNQYGRNCRKKKKSTITD